VFPILFSTRCMGFQARSRRKCLSLRCNKPVHNRKQVQLAGG